MEDIVLKVLVRLYSFKMSLQQFSNKVIEY